MCHDCTVPRPPFTLVVDREHLSPLNSPSNIHSTTASSCSLFSQPLSVSVSHIFPSWISHFATCFLFPPFIFLKCFQSIPPALFCPFPSFSTLIIISTLSPLHHFLNKCFACNFALQQARILGFRDGESQFGEFPWMTAILNAEPVMGKVVRRFVGGGSLIHPRVVVTAAHKVLGWVPANL